VLAAFTTCGESPSVLENAFAFTHRCGLWDPSLAALERRDYEIINGSRRKRIARGSGTTVQEVNNLLRQYVQMHKMFKSMGSSGSLKAPTENDVSNARPPKIREVGPA
jgi:signal recognition particle GTPase